MSNPSLKSDPGSKPDYGPRGHGRPRREVNLRAAIILGILILIAVPAFFLAQGYQVQHERSALLAEAKELLARKPPEPNLALTYLNEYLKLNPNDMEALDVKSKTLFDLVRNQDQAAAAIQSHEQIVLKDNPPRPPGGGKRHLRYPEARRRLVKLNLATKRLNTAHAYAQELIDSDTVTAEDYRLLGHTLAALGDDGAETIPGPGGKPINVWQEAIRNFEEAQRLEPGNPDGAKSLANLYRTRRKDPKKAEQVLEVLLKSSQTDSEKAAARLVRYEHFSTDETPDAEKKARAELDEATRLQPHNADVLLRAAVDAMRRGDTEKARKYIEDVPPDVRKETRYAVDGEINAQENKLDQAIEDWREGLKVTGGTSETLTWRIAFVLLRLGRVEEAQPLVDQYHRLTDRPTSGANPKGVFLDALKDLKLNQPEKAIAKLEDIRLKTDDNTPGARKRGLGIDQPLEAEVLYTLGQSYEAYGRELQALAAYRQAAKVVRSTKGLKWADPWIGAANVLLRRNNLEEAASELQDGLVAMPSDPNLMINLLKLSMVQQTRLPKDRQQWNDVEKNIDRVRKAIPTSVDLIKLQVAYYMTNGQYTEAAKLLASATDPKNHPRNPELWALQAEVQRQLKQPDQALEALDRGTNIVGEQAILRIARAQILLKQGQEKAAYDSLNEGLGLVPPEQRWLLYQAMAELHRRSDDPAQARKAYADWAKMEPANPKPQLAILELALDADDVPAAKASIAKLDKIGGLGAQLAQAIVLLNGRLNPARDKDARARQLDDAARVIKSIRDEYPGNAIGYLLEGQLFELKGRVDEAVQDYRAARDHNGGPEALRRLVSLLARARRYDELARLKSELNTGEMTLDLEQVETRIAIESGDTNRAISLMQDAIKGNPEALDVRLWQVQVLYSLGKAKEAESILVNQIRQHPDQLQPRFTLMMLQLSQQQIQEAAETIEEIRKNVKLERPEFVWAGCYAALGNTTKATEYYKESLQKWPNDQDVRKRAVSFFRVSGHLEDAEAALRQILEREPKHAWATRELAQLLSAHVNDPAAWNESIKLIGEKPTSSDTADDRLVRATVLARAPDPARRSEAIPILEGLINDSPGAVATMAHDLIARVYADSNQLDKALEHAQSATTRNNDPNTIAFYIDLLLRGKKFDEAMKQVDRIARGESESFRVVTLRALILQAQGQSQEAAKRLEERFAILEKENAPDEESQGRKILDMLVAFKQLDAAERVGRRLAERRPHSAYAVAPILAKRGLLSEALQYCQEAVDHGSPVEGGTTAVALVAPQGPESSALVKQADAIVDRALKQKPDHFGLVFARASLKRRMGLYEEAARMYRDMVTRTPDNPALLNNMAWTLSEDLNQPEQGLEKINAAIKLIGPNPSCLDTRGVILTHMGKLDQAIEDLETAAKMETAAKTGPSATLYYHLARAYKKAGRTAEFQKYRDLAKQAGLTAGQLEPNERPEMQQLMN